MKIKNVNIDGNLFLAPMAGVTDFAFRSIAREYGASFSYTEMVSAKALVYDNKKTKDLLITLDNEKPVGVQLFGSEKSAFKEALKLEELEKFDIIDINMGCPAPKIVKNGDGSKLMTNFSKAREILNACVKATNKPITVKMRLGYDKDVSLDFAKMLEENGASAITVHGRLREEFYSGQANLDAIARVKQSVKIPVIGNGDVVDEISLKRMLKTGVDGVMIGRAALGKPYIFSELLGKSIKVDKFSILKKHIELLSKYYSKEYLSTYMKKHMLWYLKEEKGASKVKLEICQEKDLDKCLNILQEFFKK